MEPVKIRVAVTGSVQHKVKRRSLLVAGTGVAGRRQKEMASGGGSGDSGGGVDDCNNDAPLDVVCRDLLGRDALPQDVVLRPRRREVPLQRMNRERQRRGGRGGERGRLAGCVSSCKD